MIKAFFIALQLMTRIPVPAFFHITEQDSDKLFGWSVLFYPLVGLIIGGLLLLLFYLLSFSPSGSMVTAGLILTLWVLITGALHLDGLADSADAWLGGYGDQQRTLEIMKDPYCGPAAVVVLLLVLLLKFSALIAIEWQVLLLAPVFGRTAAMLLLATTPYVRQGGMGETAVNNLSKKAVWSMTILVIALSIFLLKESIFALPALFVIGYLFRTMMIKRIKGTTGDTTGALVEVMEISTLIVFVLLTGV
jgi:adenosylcobinamide-GDP ribazoletransferase